MLKISTNYFGKIGMASFKIIETAKRKKDIENAIEIYLSTIDIETSYTNTNQIKEHILSNTKNENRQLFFYNLYLNDELFGFAEFGYLPKTETLVIDYICTKIRNQCAFYMFYQLCIEEISNKAIKNKSHIKYIITEISLLQINGIYCDADSNYFRKMLSLENFVILSYPYYQPNFENNYQAFAMAIKSVSSSNLNASITPSEYLRIVEELYVCHYGTWYKKYIDSTKVDNTISDLLSKINREISPQKSNINSLSLVSCPIFEAGKCQNINIEPITVKKKIEKYIFNTLFLILWLAISVLSCLAVIFDITNIFKVFSSTISVVSGIITMILYFRNFFRN